MRRAIAFAASAALAVACGEEPVEETDRADEAPADAIEKVSDAGPVKATLRVWPSEPRLGDPITLELEVEAEPGVSVEMPAFGEALGRFTIVDYTPREHRGASGKTLASQTYRLQAPMSGLQRIPPLRIEFVDERPGQARDAGAAAIQEILTEEIPIQVQSVTPDGPVASELRPPLERLEPPERKSWIERTWFVPAAVLLVVAGIVGFRIWRRRARERARIDAYAAAMRRLTELESRGVPTDDVELDAWYVELSGIVRRYLEDRYGVRAPELTTQEFLHEAQRSPELTDAHRDLLVRFLEGCDRVKFAGYRPDEAESAEAIAAARRFLDDTRPRQEEAARAAA